MIFHRQLRTEWGKWNTTAGGRWKRRTTRPITEESGSMEDVRNLRLMALLHELVREKGSGGDMGHRPRDGCGKHLTTCHR